MLLFDTRRGVFRSPELRRAANLALDRSAIARRLGGDPRSLLIPAGIPGHRAGQAYPTRPNLRRARALASGHHGSAVIAVPAGSPEFAQLPSLLRRDLARIGVRAEVRPLADPVAAAADQTQRIDAILITWAPDYPDPFGIVNFLLQPGAHAPGFPDLFGAPRWVRRMQAAAAAPLERRDAVYARLDADLARGPAPLAVLGSPAGAPQLYSARLGCERFAFGRMDLGSLCIR
jgi:ABC-type transport system substrate-binding protein